MVSLFGDLVVGSFADLAVVAVEAAVVVVVGVAAAGFVA